MSIILAPTSFILGFAGDINYPAICKDTYLSDEQVQNVAQAEKALLRKPGCMKIGEETIAEGDRAGDTFSVLLAARLFDSEG